MLTVKDLAEYVSENENIERLHLCVLSSTESYVWRIIYIEEFEEDGVTLYVCQDEDGDCTSIYRRPHTEVLVEIVRTKE